MKIIECAEAEFDQKVATLVTKRIMKWKLTHKDDFYLGLTGGKTAQGAYALLSASKTIDWGEVMCLLTDERFVPSDSDDSNLKMLLDVLVDPAGIPDYNVVGFDTESLSFEESAEEMSLALQDLLEEKGYLFDLLLLGVGPDGHIASIFPGSEALTTKELATTSETDEFAVKKRLTFSLKAVSKAKEVILLLKGEEKQDMFEKLQGQGGLPVQLLIANVEKVTVVFGS